ncbi:MAG TPA: hypothetical protein VK689_06970, partial [Armatimonadota bacterium]|nr:hypothetical protein [Armatimonadota bacterium]
MTAPSPNILYYGREEPLPEQVPLRAGPLSLVYEAGDLRYVRLGDREIVRRIYAAVRNHNWDTLPAALSNVHIQDGGQEFRITYDAEHRAGDVDFAWQAVITGGADGTLRFTMDGAARSSFRRNRIGLSVLHPVRECAGAPCTVEHVDGSREEASFPLHVSPQQPFREIRALSHDVAEGVAVEVRLEGDVFEMEDQRNWTDASFKTYCTPLDLPFPVEVPAGTRISQAVSLTLRGGVPASTPRADDAPITVTIDEQHGTPLPALGLGMASHPTPLAPEEAKRLRALNPGHLRADLDLSAPGFEVELARATVAARALDVPLELALFLPGDADAQLEQLKDVLVEWRPRVLRWLVFASGGAPVTPLLGLARQVLGPYDPGAPFGGGTNANFAELNRSRPALETVDLLAYSINPQVHAFDNDSLAETLEAQAATLESARRFAGGKAVVVSPVTLRPRFNAVATGPVPEPPPGELPPQVDERQRSLFGAAWTVGSVKYLAESAAAGVTYYETTGWRGVMEMAAGSPLPHRFPSRPGEVFPLYHVLADVGELAGGEVLHSRSSQPLKVEVLALRKDGVVRLLLANLSPAL